MIVRDAHYNDCRNRCFEENVSTRLRRRSSRIFRTYVFHKLYLWSVPVVITKAICIQNLWRKESIRKLLRLHMCILCNNLVGTKRKESYYIFIYNINARVVIAQETSRDCINNFIKSTYIEEKCPFFSALNRIFCALNLAVLHQIRSFHKLFWIFFTYF